MICGAPVKAGALLFGRFFADGMEDSDVPVLNEADKGVRVRDFKVPIGFSLFVGDFGSGFAIGNPHRTAQAQFAAGFVFDPARDFPCAVEIHCLLCYVEVRLVQCDILRGGGIGVPDFVELGRDRGVFLKDRVQIDPVGTAAIGFLDVHCRSDSILPSLIAAGGHDAPLIGQSANHQGLASQGRIVPHLNGGIEGVHIHMDNYLFHSGNSPLSSRVLCSADSYPHAAIGPSWRVLRSQHTTKLWNNPQKKSRGNLFVRY